MVSVAMPTDSAIHSALNQAAQLTKEALEFAGLKGQADAVARLIPVEEEACVAKLLMVLRAVEAITRMEWAAKGTIKTGGIATALDAVATCYLAATVSTTSVDVSLEWLNQLLVRLAELRERSRLFALAQQAEVSCPPL